MTLPKPSTPSSLPLLLVAALLVHALAMWWTFGADAIGPSWRECDTQAVARNLAFEDFDLMRPRVDWRGDTTGEVECEMPIYQGVVAAMLRVFGDVDWPGRLVSLLAVTWLAASWFGLFARCASRAGAWVGVAVLLGGAQALFVGTRVMPDALSLAFGSAGLAVFVRFLDDGRARTLALATALTLVGALAKPTTLQFVALQAAFAWALQPTRLREARTWLAFGVVVAGVAAWILHARELGLATGLTFGVTFGDVKSPAPDHLLRPRLWWMLAGSTLAYGVGWIGVLAGGALLARRGFARLDALFAAIVAVGLVGAFRYSHEAAMGPQYHAVAAIFGAWLAARAWPAHASLAVRLVAGGALLVVAAFGAVAETGHRPGRAPTGHDETARVMQANSSAGELVVVRSPKPAFDVTWRRPSNFEEPVLLFLSRRKGWSLPSDGVDGARLAELTQRGARLYVETAPDRLVGPLAEWLSRSAKLVATTPSARIFRLERP